MKFIEIYRMNEIFSMHIISTIIIIKTKNQYDSFCLFSVLFILMQVNYI